MLLGKEQPQLSRGFFLLRQMKLNYWCAAEIFAIQISSRWHGTPLPHGVGVTLSVPVSVPLEFCVAPVTEASTNLLQTPALESVLSHCQLFAVLAPSVSV